MANTELMRSSSRDGYVIARQAVSASDLDNLMQETRGIFRFQLTCRGIAGENVDGAEGPFLDLMSQLCIPGSRRGGLLPTKPRAFGSEVEPGRFGGVRRAVSCRGNNLDEPSFANCNFPKPYIYKPRDDLLFDDTRSSDGFGEFLTEVAT